MAEKQKKAAMRPARPAHPGIERDAHGNAIPMKDRLPEDRAKAHRAARNKGASKKKS
ncbi:MAG TPA: hypothetical protein VGM36_16610 [Rhizomicrobium sp.]|jgi:hypothetical protein